MGKRSTVEGRSLAEQETATDGDGCQGGEGDRTADRSSARQVSGIGQRSADSESAINKSIVDGLIQRGGRIIYRAADIKCLATGQTVVAGKSRGLDLKSSSRVNDQFASAGDGTSGCFIRVQPARDGQLIDHRDVGIKHRGAAGIYGQFPECRDPVD